VFEFGVGLDDGVGADDEVFGEGTDAGELVAAAKEAGFGGVLDLLHELEVEGLAEIGVEFLEEHTVSVYGYSVMEGDGCPQVGLRGGRSQGRVRREKTEKDTAETQRAQS
jgi:hypothetical protein